MRRVLISVLFLLCFVLQIHATHNRAGEITYLRIAPFTTVVAGVTLPMYTYSITLTKYTSDGPQIADRCQDTIYFGDGQYAIVKRLNGPTVAPNCDCSTFASGGKCGEIIIAEPGYRVKKNVYSAIHTYPAAGNYLIRNYDPNRNFGVRNISNSGSQPFYLEALLVIDNFTGPNISPQFSFPPVDKACKGVCFEHNPGAFDPDGDSLSYEITTSRGIAGATLPGYFFPETGPGGSYGIDAATGLLKWCTPQFIDEYNIAFIVKEWRKGTDNKPKLIGYILRDMQVIVNSCTVNLQPQISPIDVICVEAGKIVERQLTITDPNIGDSVRLSGGGGAFAVKSQQATLSPTIGPNFYTSTFRWQTNCTHIQNQPYLSTVKAIDSGLGGENKLVTFQTFQIRVVPPAITGLSATPAGSAINLTWSPSACNPTINPLINYLVYRKNGCVTYSQNPCDLGVDPSLGYELIRSLKPNQTTFLDDNNSKGLVFGQNYSYLVVALFQDGLQSFAGVPLCTELKRDIPVLVNVDVLSTAASGSIFVRWVPPRTGPDFLDLDVFKGPYKIELLHKSNVDQQFSKVFTTVNTVLSNVELTFIHPGIKTDSLSHEYYLDFYSGDTKIGSSSRATSIFLNAGSDDRKINLNWTLLTPWRNYNYVISRRDPDSTTFRVIGTTTAQSFTDNQNIVNGKTYCYLIQSEGEYADTTIIKPLINNSQIACQTALDKTPPITPTIQISADCPTGLLQVSWTDVKSQSDDVGSYELFYKNTVDAVYTSIAEFKADDKLLFVNDQDKPFAGCYAVTATDVNGNTSLISSDFCVDICPEFELPNVFSPNGDNINDHFKAVRVRQIKQINLNVVDRWGNLVYHTTDPYFEWNGVSQVSKAPLSDGTFFFVCEVFEPRLKGVVTRNIKGTLQLVR